MLKPSSTVMNILVVALILLSTAQENHGFKQFKPAEADSVKTSNVTTNQRIKRYVPHLNPLLRTFDFFNNDECQPSPGGKRRYYCPFPNERNEWVCVTIDQLCDTKKDCPRADDEDDLMCLFHRPVIGKLEEISAQLAGLHNLLLSQQVNYLTLEHRSANSITDRLNVEHTRRIQNEKAVDIPTPQIVKTAQADEENDEDDEAIVETDDKDEEDVGIPMPKLADHAFEDLPQKAQELLMNGIGFKYLSSSRSHPFNQRQQSFGAYQGHGHGQVHQQQSKHPRRINLSQKRFLENSHPWNEEPLTNAIYL